MDDNCSWRETPFADMMGDDWFPFSGRKDFLMAMYDLANRSQFIKQLEFDLFHMKKLVSQKNPVSHFPCCDEKKMEDSQMSFVGLLRGENGIVAFGDSKGTITSKNGEMTADCLNRKKVFHMGDFLLVTCGRNECKRGDDLHCRIETIIEELRVRLQEDVIAKTKGTENRMELFVHMFHEELREQWIADYHTEYEFFFGYKNKTRFPYPYLFSRAVVSYHNYQVEPIQDNISLILTAGMTGMAPQNPLLNPFLSLEEMKKYCQTLVECVERMGDAAKNYNPVGGPVQMETLI